MKIFILFACCIPVNGAKRSIVCDLLRCDYIIIPNELFEILTIHKNKQLKDILKKYEQQYHSVITEYFDYLIEKEYGFYCSNKEINNFPDLDLHFETPEKINNAIIDINQTSQHNFEKIFTELEIVGCKFIELRFFNSINYTTLLKILSNIEGKVYRNIDILIQFNDIISKKLINYQIFSIYPQVGNINIYSSPKKITYQHLNHFLSFSTESVNSDQDCGKICLESFSINIPFFTESKNFNNCLNKKVSIDASGNIKNCPSFKNGYGNINEDASILDVIDSPKFTSLWRKSKDKITVCRDCEFRYICSDCRAFLNDLNEKPFKCNYNPYQCTWS